MKNILQKMRKKEFENFTLEELKLIINNENIFSLRKIDKKALEKLIEKNNIDENKDKITAILQEALPPAMTILNNLDSNPVAIGAEKVNFREMLLADLNQMSILQLCIFLDKVMMISDEKKLNFFRNRVYSLHEINGAISKSLGLSLVFEVFKPGTYKTFRCIDYTKIDKTLMIEAIDRNAVRYLYILVNISKTVLTTEENLFGTKINKTIRDDISEYVKVIHESKKKIKETGIKPTQSWTYTLCNTDTITVEDDEDDFGE